MKPSHFKHTPTQQISSSQSFGAKKRKEEKNKRKTRARWMDGADDLTQTHTGANQYPPEPTFTFKTALKEQGERGRKRE